MLFINPTRAHLTHNYLESLSEMNSTELNAFIEEQSQLQENTTWQKKLETHSLGSSIVVNVSPARLSTELIVDDIEFIVAVRFRIEDKVYVSDGNYAFCASQFKEDMAYALEEALRIHESNRLS